MSPRLWKGPVVIVSWKRVSHGGEAKNRCGKSQLVLTLGPLMSLRLWKGPVVSWRRVIHGGRVENTSEISVRT